jgi:hypothetical protein
MRGRAISGRDRAVIGLAAIRAVWGTTLLLAPDSVLRTVGAARLDALTRCVAQALGVRELIQAMLAVRYRSRASNLGGAAVDATHAATMLALAIRRPASRRPATASALTAAAFAIAGLRPGCRETATAPVAAAAAPGG